MDATLAIAIVALVLGGFASALHARELVHAFRFRQPVFVLREFCVPYDEDDDSFLLRAPETIRVDVRGASRLVSITSVQCMIRERRRVGVGGGIGQELETPLILKPEIWTTIDVEVLSFGLPKKAPDRLFGEIFFRNPVDRYVAEFCLKRMKNRNEYALDDATQYRQLMAVARRPWYSALARSASRRLGIEALLNRIKR